MVRQGHHPSRRSQYRLTQIMVDLTDLTLTKVNSLVLTRNTDDTSNPPNYIIDELVRR